MRLTLFQGDGFGGWFSGLSKAVQLEESLYNPTRMFDGNMNLLKSSYEDGQERLRRKCDIAVGDRILPRNRLFYPSRTLKHTRPQGFQNLGLIASISL